jgi:hypothetical protein
VAHVTNRSIQIKLAKDDVVFLQDIPQAGAHLWNPILAREFKEREVFPLHSDAEANQLANYTPEQLMTYRYVSGQFWTGPHDKVIYHHLTPNPLRLVAFRNPIQRVAAVYADALQSGRISKETTLEQFVRDEANFGEVWNVQTRTVVGAVPGNIGNTRTEVSLPDKALLFLAKQNIEQFNALLIDECLEESADLLGYCLGLKVKPPMEGFPALPAITPEARAAIEACTQLDQKLYEAACDEFKQRHTQMQNERLARAQRTSKEKFIEAIYPGVLAVIRTLRVIRRRYFPANTNRDILRIKFVRKIVNVIIKV